MFITSINSWFNTVNNPCDNSECVSSTADPDNNFVHTHRPRQDRLPVPGGIWLLPTPRGLQVGVAMHAYICISQSYWYCETHIVVYIYVAERLIQREHCNVKGGGGSPCFDKMAEFLRTPAISLIFLTLLNIWWCGNGGLKKVMWQSDE